MTKIGQYVDNLIKNGYELVAKFSPMEFDNFIKLISSMSFLRLITIENQELLQKYNDNIFVKCSFKDSTPEKFSISCLFNKESISLLKSLTVPDKMYLLKNVDKYIFTNGNGIIKQELVPIEPNSKATLPNFTELRGSLICLNKTKTKTYNAYLKKATFAELIVFDNVPAAFTTNQEKAYVFKEETISEYVLKTPTRRYLSEAMPLIQGTEVSLTLLKDQEELWLMHNFILGVSLAITIYEKLIEISVEDDLEFILEPLSATPESDQENSTLQ